MSNIIRRSRIPITTGLVGEDQREREKQAHELNNQLDELFAQLTQSVEALDDETTSTLAGNFVLHGLVIPSTLPGALLHKDLTGADLHDPKAHKDRHVSAGADAFISTDLIEALVKRVQDDLSPTAKNYELGDTGGGAGWQDGLFLKVVHGSPNRIVSSAVSGSALAGFADNESVTFSYPAGTATLANTPNPASSLQLFVRYDTADPTTSGWVFLRQGEQYTLSSAQITLLAASPPTDAVYCAFYRYSP